MIIITPNTVEPLTINIPEPDTGEVAWSGATNYTPEDVIYRATTNRQYEALDYSLNAIPENSLEVSDYPLWNKNTDYTTDGQKVRWVDGIVYRSLQNSGNVGKNPQAESSFWAQSTVDWRDIGGTNAYKLIDDIINTQSESSSDIIVTFNTSLSDKIGLFNIEGQNVNIKTYKDSVAPENLLLDQDVSFVVDTVTTYSEYIYQDTTNAFKSNVVIDIPINANSISVLTLSGGSPNKIGVLLAGRTGQIGITQPSARFTIEDYSQKSTENNITKFEPGFSQDENSYNVLIDNDTIIALQSKIKILSEQGKLAVFYADDAEDSERFLIYGFISNFDLVAEFPDNSIVNFKIKSII